MSHKISLSLSIVVLLIHSVLAKCPTDAGESNYLIPKENGEIVLAYKAFEDFLNTDRSWESYERMLLKKYPSMQIIHDKQLSWGTVDSSKFPIDLEKYKKEDFESQFNQYSETFLSGLYDSVITKAHTILEPVTPKRVDMCLYLPYGGCFVDSAEKKDTICISMWVNPDEVGKIVAHEYAHALHFQRRPDESLSLGREIVAEGFAVYMTTLIDENLGLKKAIPFMPESSIDWCLKNEQLLKDTIRLELEDSSMKMAARYIADGSFATPPEGFPQKTAYFIGYQLIKACVDKGMTLEEICSLDSKSLVNRSGYFSE